MRARLPTVMPPQPERQPDAPHGDAAERAAGSHYSDPAPTVRSAKETVTVRLADVSFRMRTDRGVFSHGRLDAGTGVLLRAAPPLPPTGTGLDLGCGAGAIALTMALRAPDLRVWAVDVNQRARALCSASA